MDIQHEIVEVIYDVPLGNSSWQDVIHLLKKEFNALIGFMLIIRPNQAPSIVSTLPKDHELWKSYDEYFYSIDPWNELLTSNKLSPNICYPGHLFLDGENYYNKKYYNDFWKPHGLYHTAGGLLFTRNNISIVLGFPRAKSTGPYENSEATLMTFYGRQVVRAIELEGVFGNSFPNQIYEDSLAASYGLTKAESRLVLELFKCGSLPETSKSLNRSYHTVRNQMKSILKKTETSNQIELFKLLVTNI